MKDSIKALVLIFMIANAFSADLTINKKFKLGLKTQKAQKSKSKEKAGLKMIRSSRYSSKTQDPATGVAIAVYLITKVIDSITKYFNDKAQALEDLVKDLKNKNLQTLATFRETVQEMKTSLCNSIRNSNFFFFDFLTYFLIDLYFRRKHVLSTIKLEMIKKLKRKHSTKFSFRSLETRIGDFDLNEEVRKIKEAQERARNAKKVQPNSYKSPENNDNKNNGSSNNPSNQNDEEKRKQEQQNKEEEEAKQKKQKEQEEEEERNKKQKEQKEQNEGTGGNTKPNEGKEETIKPSDGKTQEQSEANKLAPYDNLSQSIFAVKQSLKSFQNSICNFDNDIVDENNFIRARSEGIAISLTEDTEGNFFYVSKIVLDFGSMLSDIAFYAARENKADFTTNKDLTGTLNAQNSDKSAAYQEYKNRMGRLSGLGVRDADGNVVQKAENFFLDSHGTAYMPYLEDPVGFFKQHWGFIVTFFESVKKLGNLTIDLAKGQSQGDVKRQYLEAFSNLVTSLLNLIVTIYLLKGFYDFIQAVKGTGDFWTGFGNAFVGASNTQKMAYDTAKIPLQIPQLVGSVFDYIMVRYDNIDNYHGKNAVLKAIAGSKIWVAKKKMWLQIAKTIFLFMLYCLGPYILVGLVRLLKGLTVALMKSGWSATQSAASAAQMCINIVFVLKIFICLLQLALAILRYIKAKRIARDVRNDFYGEKRLRDNMLEQLKIQIVFVTFKYNTVILQSFQDILRFYETVVKFEDVKKVPLKNDSEHVGASKMLKDEIGNQVKKVLKTNDQKCTIPSRYHNLDTTSFFIKLCQENETYCTRHLTPSILLNAYHLPEKDVETIFKISYNDLVAGPISDIYVATPGSTLLSEPYLDQGNWKFYRKSIPDKASQEKGEDVGETFAILYRRCGNALNYLEDVNYFTVNIPSDLYKIFENRKEIVDKISAQSDAKNRGFIVNSYFSTETPAPSPTGVKRKMVYFTLNTSEGIDKLRGDDKKTCEESKVASDPTTTQRSLIFSLDNFAEKKVYDFATMTWEEFKCGGSGDYSTCSYLFSFLDGSTPPNGSTNLNKVIEYYQNPCHKVLGSDNKKSAEEKKVVLAKLDSSSSLIYAKATQETKTHVNLYDQRFYGSSRACYGNFDRLDKAILKIDQNFVNINSVQYLESQTECYETKKQLSINAKMSEAEFIFSAQVNLLKSRISIIKSEVCNAYVLFKPQKPVGNDSVCTKAQETEFQELGIFFCDTDNQNFVFFQTLQSQYGVVPTKAKIYNYIETDEKNTISKRELTTQQSDKICDDTPTFGKQKFYFYNFLHTVLPNPSLFWNLKGTAKGMTVEQNAFLMRHNTQFNDDEDDTTTDIPSLYELDKTLYDQSISLLIGKDRAIIGRAGGQFHLVVPISREITVKDPNTSQDKKVISDLVFRVDRRLQILLGRHKNQGKEVDLDKCKIKGNIFKVMLSDEIDPDAALKIDYEDKCVQRPSEKENTQKAETQTTQSSNSESSSDSKVNINVQSTMNSVQDQMVINENADSNVEGFKGGNKPQFVLNPPLIEFAKPYKYMYVEFRLFETVHWYEFLTADKSDYMNLSGLEFLLDNCFILYWPRFKSTYKDLEINTVQPEPTFNFYVPFNYSSKWSLVSRYWVKYDFFFTNEKLDIDCAEEVKTIGQRKRIFKRIK